MTWIGKGTDPNTGEEVERKLVIDPDDSEGPGCRYRLDDGWEADVFCGCLYILPPGDLVVPWCGQACLLHDLTGGMLRINVSGLFQRLVR